MSPSLRLLIVEDSEDDVLLLLHTLQRGGYEITNTVVDTPAAMRAALEGQRWDVITSDHSMPRFSAPDALALAQRFCPDVPFLIVSGEIDLNLAVSLMRGGAKDYIQKQELARLVPAIERELREAQLRRERQQVDSALQKSDERLREVLENSLDAAYKRDIRTDNYEYLSPVYFRLTGYAPQEAQAMSQETILSLVHPDDLAEFMRVMAEAARANAESAYQVEFRFKHKDGRYRWLQDSFTVLCDAERKPLSRIGNLRDIGERRRLDAERDALLEIMQGIAVTKDLQEILALVHRSIARLVAAKNFFVIFYNQETGLFEEVYSVDQYDPPAPPSRLDKSITAYVYHTGKPLIITQELFDELEANGEVELVGTNSASWMGAPLNTPDGPIGVMAVQDYETTGCYTESDKDFLAHIGSQVALALERQQAEEARRENSELLDLFMQRSPIYCFIKESSPTRSVTMHASENYQEMIGIPGHAMIGRSMEELFPPEFAAKITADDWAVVSKGDVFQLDEELNGRSYTTIKFPIVQGNKTYLAGYTIDMTERIRTEQALMKLVEDQKKAQEQIRRLNAELEQRVSDRTAQLTAANQELEAFSYSVSHDLRAPLRSLKGFSSLLLEDYAGQMDEKGRHYLSRIQDSSRRMEQLVNDLLNLSRITRADLTSRKVDLSSLAERIAAELHALAPARQVTLDIAPNLEVRGDENLIKIAMQNLLDNAYKFTGRREQAVIQVGSEVHDGGQVFFVRDNGAGFNMDYAERLFGAFQRLHPETDFPGVGIGLATVQRIIRRHGGRVWARGEVDKGATFYFTLS